MPSCNVCGNFALGTTTCNLCALGKTPNTPTKKLAKMAGDRHRIPDPKLFPDMWLEVLIQTRVVELFKTLPGLRGHWEQVQALVNSAKGSMHFYDNYQTTDLGKEKFGDLAVAIINVAADAGFDFPVQELRFTHDLAYLRLSKTKVQLKVHSKPLGSIRLKDGIGA